MIDRTGRGLQVLERRRHEQDPSEWLPLRQEDPRARRPRRRHRVRAPRPLDDGRVGVRRQARRHDHHVRGDVGLQDRVRQPLPLDEPEDAQGLHFANYREAWEANRLVCEGHDPPDAVGGVSARRDRRGRAARCTTTSPRARSACCASRRKEGLGDHRPERRRAKVGEDSDHALPAALMT